MLVVMSLDILSIDHNTRLSVVAGMLSGPALGFIAVDETNL